MRAAPCRAAAIAAACALLGAGAQAQTGAPVAALLVSGPYVTVNGRPAQNGMSIDSGDRVVTGPASSARINFFSGGSVQLDANTDPEIYGSFVDYLGCWVRVLTGQLYSDGEGQTICFSHGAEQIVAHSAFNLQVGSGREVVTVAAGAVTITGPHPVTVPAGAQASLAGGRVVAQRQVGPDELRRITAWRRNFAFAPPRQPAYPPPAPSYPTQPYPTQPYPNPSYPTQPYPGQYYPFPIPSIPWPGLGGGHRQPGTEQPSRGGDRPSYPGPITPPIERGGTYPGTTPRSGGSDSSYPR
jgi:hypothetical protein